MLYLTTRNLVDTKIGLAFAIATVYLKTVAFANNLLCPAVSIRMMS